MPFDEEELDPHGECRAEIKRLRAAIRWALGEAPSSDGKWFGEHKGRSKPYWWRTHLRRLSGIDASAP